MEKTINQVFRNQVKKYGDRLAVEKNRNGIWEAATWNEYYERSRAVGLGMYELGIRRGDMVAILSENRLEWNYTDMGGQGIGACVIGIYTTVKADEVSFIAQNSGAKIIIVENKGQLEKARAAMNESDSLKYIAIIDEAGCTLDGERVIGLASLVKKGNERHKSDPGLFERLADEVEPDDLCLLQYTSGTTGVPKGAMITHGNIMAELRALDAVKPPYGYETDHVVGFLPLSHIFERVPVHYYVMYKGITKHMAGSIDTVADDFKVKQPMILFAVPRVLEKIYQKMQLQVSQKPPVVQKLFAWAQRVGADVSKCAEENKKPGPFLKFKHKLAYALVFKKLQEALGGRIRWICAAGAPISRDIVNFFNAAGIFILEGYGLSEICGGATLSNLNDFSPGSVGRFLPGIEYKIADDGEILIRGDMLFKGYYRMEEETREAFDGDGYFKTGDIGVIDERGLLYITDRKKDLLITAGGKNVAPQKIETLCKKNPLFAQVVVVGDRKKYLTALLNLNLEIAEKTAREYGIQFSTPSELGDNHQFLRLVDKFIEDINGQLARYETIKKYTVLKNEFSQETGELTVSLKVKRNVVQEKYQNVIEAMYSE